MADKLLIDTYNDGAEYEPTDSENDYDDEEKALLREVRESRRRETDPQKELMAFADSDDNLTDQEELDDSDIEGQSDNDDDIPDAKDWGSKSRNYYNTDFVDPDYSTYNEQEQEMAQQEEEEAKIIQQRLAKQMNEADFLLDDANILVEDDALTHANMLQDTVVKADFSSLSKRERLQLFLKDSPEFPGLVSDFNEFFGRSKKLLTPIMEFIKERNTPRIPALEFTKAYNNLLLTYCGNIIFYLILKGKRISVKDHPVISELVKMKQLMHNYEERYANIIKPQLDALLERFYDGAEFNILENEQTSIADASKMRSRSKLSILNQYESNQLSTTRTVLNVSDNDENLNSSDDNEMPEDLENESVYEANDDTRRGITYQIAKNKGLMPARKKELRNPRVKHRSKFRKALIRRKGAIRTVRKESKRYAGELSGIKTSVTKSVKFKA